MSVKKSAPWCHPTFLLPQYQELDEGDPLTALCEVKAMWEKAMEKKAWKLPTGDGSEGGLHSYAFSWTAVRWSTQLVRKQRASGFDSVSRPAHADSGRYSVLGVVTPASL